MRVALNPAAGAELLRRANDAKEERDAGVHVSDLVRCRRQYWYEHNGYPKPPHDNETLLLFLMGAGHHAFLQNGVPEETLHWCSPSGIMVHGNVDYAEPDVDGPTELKTTRSSAKKRIWEMQHYVEQVACYAVMKGKAEARVHVFHLLGDYTGPKKAQHAPWDIWFTRAELAMWEREMDRRAQVLLSPEIPSLDEHRSWECDYCPYLAKRGGPCEGSKGNKVVWFVAENELDEAKETLRV